MIKVTAVFLLPVALVAYGIGYLVSSARKVSRALRQRLRRDWRTVSYGPLEVRTPPTWGDFEPTVDGMVVLHNRPAKMRVDGDLVWYGSTIEMRFYAGGEQRTTIDNASRSWRRQLGTKDTPIVVELIVANGVRPTKEREALAVFKTVRLAGSSSSLVWPTPGDVNIALRSVVPKHDSKIARDFETF